MSQRAAEVVHRLVRGAVLCRRGIVPELHARRQRAFERLDPEMQSRVSLALLRHAVFNAYHSVPYYKRRFDDLGVSPREIRSAKDLAHLPILTKRDIIEQRNALVGAGAPLWGARWDATGGSTGEPLRFLRSRRAAAVTFANEFRLWRWYGVPAGARRADIWGADRDLSPGDSDRSLRQRLLGNRQLNAFLLTEERCRTFCDVLRRFRPQIVYGYATALARFARFVHDTDESLPDPPLAIRSTAEVLLTEHRTLIEHAFGAPVFDYYGARETGALGGECSEHRGLHVFPDVNHIEIVRVDGSAAEPGEVGEVVVTTLHEFAMPLIRYRSGDRAALLTGDCPCGSAFPRISSLQGRVGDFVQAPDGRAIHGEYFTHLFYGVPGVARFQVRQIAPDRLEILVEAAGPLETGELERIRVAAARQFGAPDDQRVALRVVDGIQPSASGKHRFVLPYQGSVR